MSPLHDVRRRPVRSALTAAGIAIGVAALVLLGTLAPMVFGVDVAALERNRRSPPPRVRSGRLVPTPGSDEVVLGSQVARHFQVDTGATIAIRGKTFRVAGVLEPTLTGPDSFVFM